jgi:hypothetical protein
VNYKGIDYSLKLLKPCVWQYRFQIGRAIKAGKSRVSDEQLAVRRVEQRIDRELMNAAWPLVDAAMRNDRHPAED